MARIEKRSYEQKWRCEPGPDEFAVYSGSEDKIYLRIQNRYQELGRYTMTRKAAAELIVQLTKAIS
jgi:hypothetical protein